MKTFFTQTKKILALSFIFVFLLLSTLSLTAKQVGAQSVFENRCGPSSCPYVFLAPISILVPGTSFNVAGDGANTYLRALYTVGIVIASALAVVMIVIGGAQYASTDAIGGKSDGKKRIQGAIGGLILALLSYTILRTINPNLVVINFSPAEITNIPGGATAVTPVTNQGVDSNGQACSLGTTGCNPVQGGTPCTAGSTGCSGGTINSDGVVVRDAPGSRFVANGNTAIDYDGSPGTYRVVQDPNGNIEINGVKYRSIGRDSVLNAQSADGSGKWVGVKTDSSGNPIIDSEGNMQAQLSWGTGSVNGDTMAFVALSPSQLAAAKAHNPNFGLGQNVLLTANGKTIEAVYADNAPSYDPPRTEVSPAAAKALGLYQGTNNASGQIQITLP